MRRVCMQLWSVAPSVAMLLVALPTEPRCSVATKLLINMPALQLHAAQVASALGCRCFIAMPDDAAIEKAQLLQALGEQHPPDACTQTARTLSNASLTQQLMLLLARCLPALEPPHTTS